MNLTRKQVLHKFFEKGFVKERKKFPQVIDCTYVRITKTLGIKCFYDSRLRNIIFKRQKKFAKLHLAPKAYYSFNLEGNLLSDNELYCYVTQHAKLLSNISDENPNYIKLDKELKKHKFDTDDLHYRNIGKINGKLVCIDFG